jgi:hypothetical protein
MILPQVLRQQTKSIDQYRTFNRHKNTNRTAGNKRRKLQVCNRETRIILNIN